MKLTTRTPDPSDRSTHDSADGTEGAHDPAPRNGAYDQLGTRLAESIGRRVDALAPASTVRLAPYSALRRTADRVRHTRRFAIAAVTGAVTVTAGIAVGTAVVGGDNGAVVGTTEPPTPMEQAAAAVGRYAPTVVPADLTLQSVMFQGSATVEPLADTWVQVFAPESANLAHPGLLVTTVPPPTFEYDAYGEEITVGGHPARLVTSPDGALSMSVQHPDALIRFETVDLSRDELLAVAASAVVEPGRRGVTLTGLPPTWSSVLSQAATTAPYVELSYMDDTVIRQLSLTLEVAPGYSTFRVGHGAEPVTLDDGTIALLARSSEDDVALYWVSDDGVGIRLSSYQLEEAEVLAAANSVRSLDEDEWTGLAGSAEVVWNYLEGDPGANAEGASATTSAAPVVTSADAGRNWQDAGFDLDTLPVGSFRTAGESGWWWLVARVDDDTIVGVVAIRSNFAGSCDLLTVDGGEKLGWNGGGTPQTGSIADPDRPEAAAFVDDCTGATYALDGTVVSGSAVGLDTFPVRVTADGAVEYSPDNQEAGRPAA
jgi:hypothetical protein